MEPVQQPEAVLSFVAVMSWPLGDVRNRAYDPVKGRWINRDPIKEVGGGNLLAYVGNNPVMGSDPYGLFNIWDYVPDRIVSVVADMPEVPQSVVNFGGGLGDGLSFGLTRLGRQGIAGALGEKDNVDICSGAYKGGEWTAVANTAVWRWLRSCKRLAEIATIAKATTIQGWERMRKAGKLGAKRAGRGRPRIQAAIEQVISKRSAA